MKKLEPLVMRDFSKGCVSNVEDSLLNPNLLRYAVNMYVDDSINKTGHLISRGGISKINAYINGDLPASVSAEDSIKGLIVSDVGWIVAIVQTTSTTTYSYVYDPSAALWLKEDATQTNLSSANARIRLEKYLTRVYNPSYYNDYHLTADWISISVGGFVIKEFQGRIFIGGATATPYRLFFSETPGSTTPTFNTSTQYIDFGRNDTDIITALEKNFNTLLIFKNNSMYTWDGVSTPNDPVLNVGAVSQEVVKTLNNKTYFVGQNQRQRIGIYEYSGGEPVDISGPVQEFLNPKNSLFTSERILAQAREYGAWEDGVNYYVSIGDVTIDGFTLTNTILCYNPELKSWTQMHLKKYPGSSNNFFQYSATYRSIFYPTNAEIPHSIEMSTLIAGKALGTLTTENTGCGVAVWQRYSASTTDYGVDSILILIQTNKLYWGSRSRIKTVNKFNIFASGNYGFVDVQMRIDGGNWKSLGKLKGKTTTFSPGKQGYYFEFRLIGENTGEPFILEEIDIFDVTIEDYPT